MYQIPDGLPTLSREGHSSDSGFACVMEYISVISGEEWTDHPKCTDPLIGCVAIMLNDTIHDDEQRSRILVPMIGRIAGSAMDGSNAEVIEYRKKLAQVVRETAPDFFDTKWARATDFCGCGQCPTRVEQVLHGVVSRTVMRLTGESYVDNVVSALTLVLDKMLDVADAELGRTKRETDTAQRLMEFVAELEAAR